MQHLSEQELLRRESLVELRKMGINPYPAEAFTVNCLSSDLKNNFENHPEKFTDITLAGRIMMKRIMGKASFAELQDSAGKIQIYINRDIICPTDDKELYNVVFKKHTDLGDFVGVKGYAFKTQTGELSVHVSEFVFLSKALHLSLIHISEAR